MPPSARPTTFASDRIAPAAIGATETRRRDLPVPEALREVGETFADAVKKSADRRPAATLLLAVGFGFLLGLVWRR